MTWANRLRLLVGMVLVLALVAVLTLVFNRRQAQALSLTGTVVTSEARVGASYGGVVVDQRVVDGDRVTKGQPLFTVAVPQLGQRSWVAAVPASTAAYRVDGKAGTVTYLALATGQVHDVTATRGGYVQDGAELAQISATGTQEAVADFLLSPRDYARIEPGGRVDLRLPDDSTVAGEVRTVSVATDQARAMTRVTISSPALRSPGLARLTLPGTPVAATLTLRDDGLLAGPTDVLVDLLHKIGFS